MQEEEEKTKEEEGVKEYGLEVETWGEATKVWPARGQHILAQFNDSAILVYQAYNPTIGQHAVTHQSFEGCEGYSVTRMTWIKTNFLWMMYRSNWGKRPNQQMVLGIWLKRSFFEEVLERAKLTQGGKKEANKEKNRPCRIQWDPDHLPDGQKHCYRRAVQIGVKGDMGRQYASSDPLISPILNIFDLSPFVLQQRLALLSLKKSKRSQPHSLLVPMERPYPLPPSLASAIGLDEL
eukprot:CAMPEP_0174260144 /NCGR_PEP_ID=MMETSP0439-20130205/8871_1 /TAXON_ID=0 /ORGANISM="Stereomyxa ramosa, Strain Chinc5" /LENGTH=235 /DNA_ID=CAMNT_0015344319 /DNA_START=204 /DNA_END=911 /DNA_ORIENTATION=-